MFFVAAKIYPFCPSPNAFPPFLVIVTTEFVIIKQKRDHITVISLPPMSKVNAAKINKKFVNFQTISLFSYNKLRSIPLRI